MLHSFSFFYFDRMASQIKHKVAKNFYDLLQPKIKTGQFNDFLSRFYLLNMKTNQIIWEVRVPNSSDIVAENFQNSQQELIENKTVKSVTLCNEFNKASVKVELDTKQFIKDVLDSDPTKLNYKTSHKKVIVEFSSPNIAKPFHMGHLRSTIVGNSIANIKKKLGDDVIKLNHLGDWGTQFGMIHLGMKLENFSEDDIKKNPIQVLFKAYIRGNKESELNKDLYDEAKKVFYELENGNEEIRQKWEKYRAWTLEELNAIYSRLGVSFDEYSWESDYNKLKAEPILKALQESGILSIDRKDRQVAVLNNEEIPLIKSDGSTLYTLRDLLAIADRRTRYKFNEMYYVVDNGQSNHFITVFSLCSKLKLDEGVKIEHVKFGKVRGMSTRKGNVVFLSEVLDEANELIQQKQATSKNTKVSLEDRETTDIVGVSAVIVNDLKQRRLVDYDFSWDKSLQVKGNSGACLQYCHARLCNLETESGQTAATECDPEALLEPAAIRLVQSIARYEEALCQSDSQLEPSRFLHYLFNHMSAINSAYKVLNVKYENPHVSGQRLLLFNKSREVLNEGLRLLGMKPLKKM